MKYLFALLLLASCNSSPQQNSLTHADKISFQTGYATWKKLCSKGVPYNLEQIILGLRAAEKGENPLITEDEYDSLIHQFQEEALAKLTERNLLEAESFLKEIAAKDGAVEVSKGKLYYEKTREGKGNPIDVSRPIYATYTAKIPRNGRLETIFESEQSPMEICLEDTISGFVQGIAGMLEGEERILYIHPELAYGASAAKVDPNQLIVIQVAVFPCQIDAEPEIARP